MEVVLKLLSNGFSRERDLREIVSVDSECHGFVAINRSVRNSITLQLHEKNVYEFPKLIFPAIGI